MKLLLTFLKLLGFQIFVSKDNNKYKVVTNHSLDRAEKRVTVRSLLKIVSENALEYGEHSVHFDYKIKNRKVESGVFARKYKGYIWVFSQNKILLTVYNISNIADIMITRK